MDYFHWIGGTAFLLYGIWQLGLRTYILVMVVCVPIVLLTVTLFSGWAAGVVGLVALTAAARLMRGPVQRLQGERGQSDKH